MQAQPPTGNLQDWLFEGAAFALPDLYVFGMQELDRSAEALLYLNTTTKEDAWVDAIMRDMGPENAIQYEKVNNSLLVLDRIDGSLPLDQHHPVDL